MHHMLWRRTFPFTQIKKTQPARRRTFNGEPERRWRTEQTTNPSATHPFTQWKRRRQYQRQQLKQRTESSTSSSSSCCCFCPLLCTHPARHTGTPTDIGRSMATTHTTTVLYHIPSLAVHISMQVRDRASIVNDLVAVDGTKRERESKMWLNYSNRARLLPSPSCVPRVYLLK